MMRRACVRNGHKWEESFPIPGFESPRMPVEFCRRWFCDASRVAPWVEKASPELALGLRHEIDRQSQRKERFWEWW